MFGGHELLDSLIAAELSCRYLSDALRETEEGIHQVRDLQGASVAPRDIEAVQQLRHEYVSLVEALSMVTSAAGASECVLFTQGKRLKRLHRSSWSTLTTVKTR